MSDEAQRLFLMLREIVECCQEGEAIQSDIHGLTPAETRTLVALKYHNCHTTADLADKLFVAKSRVTRIVDDLVEKGIAIRSEDPTDRRVCVVRLTAKGETVSERLTLYIMRLHGEVLQTLPEGYHLQTLAMLGALKEAMNSVRMRLRSGELRPADS